MPNAFGSPLALFACAGVLSVSSAAHTPEQIAVVEPVIEIRNGRKPGAQPLRIAPPDPPVCAGIRSVNVSAPLGTTAQLNCEIP
ncbi:MAG: hypothetical protein IPQ07_44870 [Myxococcales bacterium]|nr:hypothetical protein [Myxococcales bacterium]